MKNHSLLVVALTISIGSFGLAACSDSVLDYRNAQINNGKVYAGDANAVFSGKLTTCQMMS